jgi:hypothetical protein
MLPVHVGDAQNGNNNQHDVQNVDENDQNDQNDQNHQNHDQNNQNNQNNFNIHDFEQIIPHQFDQNNLIFDPNFQLELDQQFHARINQLAQFLAKIPSEPFYPLSSTPVFHGIKPFCPSKPSFPHVCPPSLESHWNNHILHINHDDEMLKPPMVVYKNMVRIIQQVDDAGGVGVNVDRTDGVIVDDVDGVAEVDGVDGANGDVSGDASGAINIGVTARLNHADDPFNFSPLQFVEFLNKYNDQVDNDETKLSFSQPWVYSYPSYTENILQHCFGSKNFEIFKLIVDNGLQLRVVCGCSDINCPFYGSFLELVIRFGTLEMVNYILLSGKCVLPILPLENDYNGLVLGLDGYVRGLQGSDFFRLVQKIIQIDNVELFSLILLHYFNGYYYVSHILHGHQQYPSEDYLIYEFYRFSARYFYAFFFYAEKVFSLQILHYFIFRFPHWFQNNGGEFIILKNCNVFQLVQRPYPNDTLLFILSCMGFSFPDKALFWLNYLPTLLQLDLKYEKKRFPRLFYAMNLLLTAKDYIHLPSLLHIIYNHLPLFENPIVAPILNILMNFSSFDTPQANVAAHVHQLIHPRLSIEPIEADMTPLAEHNTTPFYLLVQNNNAKNSQSLLNLALETNPIAFILSFSQQLPIVHSMILFDTPIGIFNQILNNKILKDGRWLDIDQHEVSNLRNRRGFDRYNCDDGHFRTDNYQSGDIQNDDIQNNYNHQNEINSDAHPPKSTLCANQQGSNDDSSITIGHISLENQPNQPNQQNQPNQPKSEFNNSLSDLNILKSSGNDHIDKTNLFCNHSQNQHKSNHSTGCKHGIESLSLHAQIQLSDSHPEFQPQSITQTITQTTHKNDGTNNENNLHDDQIDPLLNENQTLASTPRSQHTSPWLFKALETLTISSTDTPNHIISSPSDDGMIGVYSDRLCQCGEIFCNNNTDGNDRNDRNLAQSSAFSTELIVEQQHTQFDRGANHDGDRVGGGIIGANSNFFDNNYDNFDHSDQFISNQILTIDKKEQFERFYTHMDPPSWDLIQPNHQSFNPISLHRYNIPKKRLTALMWCAIGQGTSFPLSGSIRLDDDITALKIGAILGYFIDTELL